MKEREISLIDLLVEILLKWRVILVWMLAGGILMGGFSYISSYRTAQAQRAQIAELEEQWYQAESEGQTQQEYLQEGLTVQQVNNVSTAVCYEGFYNSTEKYLQESVRMQVDPLRVPRAELTFQVVAGDMETARRIELVYEDMVSGGLNRWLAGSVQEELSEEALSELISLERSSKELAEGGDTFSIVLYHISEEQCLQLAEKIDEYFQEQNSQLVRKMGEHQIQLVNQTLSLVMDVELASSQRSIQNNMVTWSASIAKLKEAFTDEEWQYYECLTDDGMNGTFVENEKGEQQSGAGNAQGAFSITVIQPSVSIKYVLLGMILFAFLYVFCVFLKYVLSGRIRITDDIVSIYGVPELGVIPVEEETKKLFAFVDSWILRLRNWNKRRFTVEEAMGLAAVAVKMAAKKEGLDEICCIGCNLKANAVKTADTVQNILKEANISMKILNNVLYDQEAMEQLLLARGVFLLERAGETLYDEVSREIQLLHRQDIKVFGIIVVE